MVIIIVGRGPPLGLFAAVRCASPKPKNERTMEEAIGDANEHTDPEPLAGIEEGLMRF
jgi:hypothetical protein